MASITVTREVSAGPDAVWKLLENFGDVSWIPGAKGVEVDGSGPGMRRLIRGGGSAQIVERLISVAPERRTLTYSIDENIPFPVRSYEATVTVHGEDGGQASVRWLVTFDPVGDETEAASSIDAIYGLMAGWLETAATGASG